MQRLLPLTIISSCCCRYQQPSHKYYQPGWWVVDHPGRQTHKLLFLDRLRHHHRRGQLTSRPRLYMSSPEFSAVTESIANLSLVTKDAPPPKEEEDQRSEEIVTSLQAHFPPEGQAPESTPKRRNSGNAGKRLPHSSSDTETETHSNMPSGSSSKHHHHHSSSSSSKKHGSSSSSSKHHSKGDDWSEVTEPEERRRIQNRIAQRKFRKYLKPFPKRTFLGEREISSPNSP